MTETEAFADFVRAHTPALVRSAYLLTGSAAAAEDLVQDTLLRLLPKWHKVLAADFAVAYVRRTLVNNFLNGRRRARGEVLFADIPDRLVEPDVALGVSERDLLQRLLASLGPKQRAIVIMRFLEGLNDLEIADAVGCRPGTVRSTISRSLATIRTSLATQDSEQTVTEER